MSRGADCGTVESRTRVRRIHRIRDLRRSILARDGLYAWHLRTRSDTCNNNELLSRSTQSHRRRHFIAKSTNACHIRMLCCVFAACCSRTTMDAWVCVFELCIENDTLVLCYLSLANATGYKQSVGAIVNKTPLLNDAADSI